MAATISNRGSQGEQKINDDEDINDVNSEKGTPELPIKTMTTMKAKTTMKTVTMAHHG